MKRILLASLCFLAISSLTAFAADTPTKTEAAKPVCGKTVEECQAKVDALAARPGIPIDQAKVLIAWLLSNQFSFQGQQTQSLEMILTSLNNIVMPAATDQKK